MQELRWNPVLKWWVMVSDGREKRPLTPEKNCPFCPGSGKVPDSYDVLPYANDFPILSPNPPAPVPVDSTLYRNAKSFGKCEVILYSQEHALSFGDLPQGNVDKLIDLWIEKYRELGAMDRIRYVFIFENRGKEVGVTITHPHGQIYGFPFIPKKIELELASCKEYFEREKKNLYLEILHEELNDGRRIVDENGPFVTFVPYFAEYPYQVHIIPRVLRLSIDEFGDEEKRQLGRSLTRIVTVYNHVFNREFPYMMSLGQKPTDGDDYPYYQFHIEFFPLLRNEKTQKFNASSETATWTHGNPSSPEQKAAELRTIKEKLYGVR
ncbi:MAG: galactose-1-phosphate uridylyltransferase [Chitinispirillaceae bacterium]|nr:galactose-1-phosphate uridylyltransferase [Chitinispirillaceae bacterium]